MSTKFLAASIVVCTTALTLPATSFACDTAAHSLLEREKNSLTALNESHTQASLYNFREGRCISLSKVKNTELNMGAFLPSDETALGMYQLFRAQGKNQISALKDTLSFIITEQS